MARKPKKLIKFDRRIRLHFSQDAGLSAFINGKEVKIEDALEALSKLPGVRKTDNGISVSVPSAEKLIEEFEQVGKDILVEHGYSEKWQDSIGIDHETMPEIASFACIMLSHFEMTRHWIRQNNIDAAVGETIRAMVQLAYIKNSDIEDNYLRGEKNIHYVRKGGREKRKQNIQLDRRNKQLFKYADNFKGKPHNLASCAARKFNITATQIRSILRSRNARK